MVEATKTAEKLSDKAAPKKQAPQKADTSDTIVALRILIAGDTRIKEITRRDGTEMQIHEQHAFVIGGPSNIPFLVGNSDPSKVYAEGVYTLPANCFVVDQYGSLELDRWGLKWQYLREMTEDEAKLFAAKQSDIQDFM